MEIKEVTVRGEKFKLELSDLEEGMYRVYWGDLILGAASLPERHPHWRGTWVYAGEMSGAGNYFRNQDSALKWLIQCRAYAQPRIHRKTDAQGSQA